MEILEALMDLSTDCTPITYSSLVNTLEPKFKPRLWLRNYIELKNNNIGTFIKTTIDNEEYLVFIVPYEQEIFSKCKSIEINDSDNVVIVKITKIRETECNIVSFCNSTYAKIIPSEKIAHSIKEITKSIKKQK